MKYWITRGFIAFLLLSASQVSLADAPVWKVSKGDSHIFVGGTIHLLNQKDYPLPKAFDTAFNESDSVVFEADVQEAQTPASQQKAAALMLYPEGETLDSKLSPEVLEELKKYASARGFPVENMFPFRPGLLSVTLTVLELQKLGLAGTGIDQFYMLQAINQGKEQEFLETVDDQLTFVAEMGEGYENDFIKSTLEDLGSLESTMADLKAAWRAGNRQDLEKFGIAPMKARDPKFYEQIIAKRNREWLPKIEAFFKDDDVEFVLAGALHFAGPDGVLTLLKKQGYTVEQLD